MAKAKLNPVLQMLVGALGDVVFKRNGIVSKRPVFNNRVFTPAQRQNQSRFKQGTSYITVAKQDSIIWKAYREAARANGGPASAIAMSDFFNPPRVDRIDLDGYAGSAGGTILVYASDDFGVTRVEVTISDGEGNMVEQGQAVQGSRSVWTYRGTVAVAPGTTLQIDATAYDRPGHSGTLRTTMQAG